jgi:uncharacterized protein YcaQ
MTTAAGSTCTSISADEARRLALGAQGLMAAGPRGAVGARAAQTRLSMMIRRVGAVQLDTISVLARSHELIAYARLGALGRAQIEAAYWSGDCFEYWGHAASIMPISDWPLLAFRRRVYRAREGVWDRATPKTVAGVVDRLRAEGPLTASDLGGAKSGSSWWGWSDVKMAVEYLLAAGTVACVTRSSWRRVYDLPERVVPPESFHDDLDDDGCHAELVAASGRALGVGTAADLADYFRLKRVDVERVLPATGLEPVTVDGWAAPAWADPDALAAMARGRFVTTVLSPFDSSIWDRKRTLRMFGFDHRLEAYVPKEKREHGYYTMPILAGGRLIGRLDPGRVGHTLVARQLSFEPAALRPSTLAATVTLTARALQEAAGWVGCDQVGLERVEPASIVAPLRAALAEELR